MSNSGANPKKLKRGRKSATSVDPQLTMGESAPKPKVSKVQKRRDSKVSFNKVDIFTFERTMYWTSMGVIRSMAPKHECVRRMSVEDFEVYKSSILAPSTFIASLLRAKKKREERRMLHKQLTKKRREYLRRLAEEDESDEEVQPKRSRKNTAPSTSTSAAVKDEVIVIYDDDSDN